MILIFPFLWLFLTRKQTGMRIFTQDRTSAKGHAAFYPIQSDWLGWMNSRDPDKQHAAKNEKKDRVAVNLTQKSPCHLPKGMMLSQWPFAKKKIEVETTFKRFYYFSENDDGPNKVFRCRSFGLFGKSVDDDQDGYESITWTVWHFSSSYFARTNSKGCPRRLFMHSKVKNMVSWHFLTTTLHINTLHKMPPLDGC